MDRRRATLRLYLTYLTTLGCCLLAPSGYARAHDFPALVGETKTHAYVATVYSQGKNVLANSELTNRITLMAPVEFARIQQVIDTSVLFDMPHALSICFASGDSSTRRRVRDVIIQQWPLENLTPATLTYGPSFDVTQNDALPDCPDSVIARRSFDIRVGFGQQLGKWALIGRPSSYRDDPSSMNAPVTLNLPLFDTNPPTSDEFVSTVAHEMGHVLGLLHEMQISPEACHWDRVKIENSQVPPWTDQTYNYNMDQVSQLMKAGTYTTLPYDSASVMNYYFAPSLLLGGVDDPCFTKLVNPLPDAADKQIVKSTYSVLAMRSQGELVNSIASVIPYLGDYPELRNVLIRKQQSLVKLVSP